MPHVAEKQFKTAVDLMKIYRAAYEKSKYLQDIDDKLLAYNEVINYCADSKLCQRDDSIKRNQILFWTYNNIGDMFLEKNNEQPDAHNHIYAVQYYQNALEFTKSIRDKRQVLEKIMHIYGELQDESGWRRAAEQIALIEDDGMKRQMFVELANGTDDIKLQAKYLEYALNFVTEENVSVQEKCKNTLEICARLLDIYLYSKSRKNYERIKELQKNTLELLN